MIKYLFLIAVLFLLLLAGGCVRTDVDELAGEKIECASWKKQFDRINAAKPTDRMKALKKDCEEQGFWKEVTE